MGRDPLFWCGNLAIRRRPRPSRWGCLSPALAAAPYPWRPAARPAPASPLPGPQFRRAPRRPAAQPWDRRSTPPRAPKLRSGLKLSLDPARRFGPVGNMRRAVHPPGLATAIYRPDAFLGCRPWQYIALMRSRRGLGREKHRFAAIYRLHVFKYS